MNKAQEYLINAGINDNVVANSESTNPEDWKYLSDVMGEFCMMLASQQANTADGKACPLYVDYRKSCKALQERDTRTG